MELERDGAELASEKLTAAELVQLETLFDAIGLRPGARLVGRPTAAALMEAHTTVGRIARALLGPAARPVRMVLFDKTERRNWGVAWHQDRTIAVKQRVETPGFGPWSRKAGFLHVEPPVDILSGMLTIRAHFDPCDDYNAPLIVARGSHRVGRVEAIQATETAAGFEAGLCLAEPGDVWIYRTPILHTSHPAAKPSRRRVMQVDFAAVDLPGGLEWAGI